MKVVFMPGVGGDPAFWQPVAVSTPDAHVAQGALDRDALLLSHDTVFCRIAKIRLLRIARG